MNIGILNYDAGNIYSVYNSINNLGFNPKIIKEKNQFRNIDKLIVPGVGSAFQCIHNLKKFKLFDLLKDNLNSELPILGICLGLQIFCDKLYENGECKGLGYIKAEVDKIGKKNHFNIGWSKVEFINKELISIFNSNRNFYFCHSYCLQNIENYDDKYINAYVNFKNFKIPCMVKKNNFLGVQFHPEKSQTSGIKFLNYFLSN